MRFFSLAVFRARPTTGTWRGLFVSMVGFRQEVVLEFTRGASSNIILMDGQDLALILEGHISRSGLKGGRIAAGGHQ